MAFPLIYDLSCNPLGSHRVTFDVMDEDEDFLVSDDLGQSATAKIIDNWIPVWTSAYPMIDQLLKDYKQDATTAELLAISANTLNVIIMLPDDDDEEGVEFRFDLFLNKKTEHGSIVFGVEFVDLMPESATATF